jgi:hypothetical protein
MGQELREQNKENSESESQPDKRSGLPCSCASALILVVLLCSLPIILNTVNTLLNQIKWSNWGIDDYSIALALVGPGGQSPENVMVQDGKITEAYIQYIDANGEAKSYPGYPLLHLTVMDLFNKAYGCFLYNLCHVEYDENYGYPMRIGGGFIEFSWIEVVSFEPSKN